MATHCSRTDVPRYSSRKPTEPDHQPPRGAQGRSPARLAQGRADPAQPRHRHRGPSTSRMAVFLASRWKRPAASQMLARQAGGAPSCLVTEEGAGRQARPPQSRRLQGNAFSYLGGPLGTCAAIATVAEGISGVRCESSTARIQGRLRIGYPFASRAKKIDVEIRGSPRQRNVAVRRRRPQTDRFFVRRRSVSGKTPLSLNR